MRLEQAYTRSISCMHTRKRFAHQNLLKGSLFRFVLLKQQRQVSLVKASAPSHPTTEGCIQLTERFICLLNRFPIEWMKYSFCMHRHKNIKYCKAASFSWMVECACPCSKSDVPHIHIFVSSLHINFVTIVPFHPLSYLQF